MKLAPILLVLLAAVSAQESNSARDNKLIERAKQVSVHELDERLPDLPLQQWTQKQSGPEAKFHWEVNDCGEQSGNPNDTGPVPTCVEVDVSLKNGREIVVFIADDRPETRNNHASPEWKMFFAQLTTPHEKINLRRLSDLPAALTKTH